MITISQFGQIDIIRDKDIRQIRLEPEFNDDGSTEGWRVIVEYLEPTSGTLETKEVHFLEEPDLSFAIDHLLSFLETCQFGKPSRYGIFTDHYETPDWFKVSKQDKK